MLRFLLDGLRFRLEGDAPEDPKQPRPVSESLVVIMSIMSKPVDRPENMRIERDE